MKSITKRCASGDRRGLLLEGKGVLVVARVRVLKAPAEGSEAYPMLFDSFFAPAVNAPHLLVGEALRVGEAASLASARVRFTKGLYVALSAKPSEYFDAGPAWAVEAEAEVERR